MLTKRNVVAINLLTIVIVCATLYSGQLKKEHENIVGGVLAIILLVNLYMIYTCYQSRMSLENFDIFGANNVVAIMDSYPGFSNRRININSGDVVVWVNMGNTDHTVTARNGSFNSGTLKRGDVYSLKFTKPGQYLYYCQHQRGWMKGRVIVS